MSTKDYCSCKLPSNLPKLMSMKAPTGRMQASQCPDTGANKAKILIGGLTMGLSTLIGQTAGVKALTPQELDTSNLEAVEKKNAELDKAFQSCQSQFVNCKQEQSVKFMEANLELAKSLQAITDEIQDQKIQKNYSLVMYAIAVGTLTLLYVLAMPTPPPAFQ